MKIKKSNESIINLRHPTPIYEKQISQLQLYYILILELQSLNHITAAVHCGKLRSQASKIYVNQRLFTKFEISYSTAPSHLLFQSCKTHLIERRARSTMLGSPDARIQQSFAMPRAGPLQT